MNSRSAALCAIALVVALSVNGQAPELVPLAHGNVPGEPHHHLKIENDYIRVYYVEAPPHESTQLHQHDHDYLYVSLGDSEVVSAVLNKPEVHLVLKDGETHFTRGGFAHVARNLADTPFRNITIELLKPQGNARNICAEVIPGAPPTKICHNPMPQAHFSSSIREFETEEVLDERYSLGPAVGAPRGDSKMARLLVVCDQSQVRTELLGQLPVDLQEGDLLWVPAGSELAIRNLLDGATSHFLLLSFKDSGPAKKP